MADGIVQDELEVDVSNKKLRWNLRQTMHRTGAVLQQAVEAIRGAPYREAAHADHGQPPHMALQDLHFMEDFSAFKARIKSYMVNVEPIAHKQLRLFQVIGQKFVLSEHALADYARFLHGESQSVDPAVQVPSLEVQLLWIVHALNPRHYHDDCQCVFGKQMAVRFPIDIEAAFDGQSNVIERGWI